MRLRRLLRVASDGNRGEREFERVVWGITACAVRGCQRDAEGWCDIFGPICLACFDRYLDYREAMTIAGGPLPYAFFEWDDGPGTVPTGL